MNIKQRCALSDGDSVAKSPFLLWSGVYSVWYRLFQGYLKTWLVNCLPSLSEPLIYLAAFGLGLRPLIERVNYYETSVEYFQFLAPGMVGVGVVSQAFFEGAYGIYIRIRYERSWHALLAGPLSYEDIFFGELLWAASKGVLGGVATGGIACLLGIYPPLVFLSGLPLIVVGSLLFAGLGVFTAGVIKTIDQINVPTFLFITPMLVLCGAYFPRSGLPPMLGFLADLLPLSLLVDLLRLHLASPPLVFWRLVWLFVWTVAVIGLAYRAVERRVRI